MSRIFGPIGQNGYVVGNLDAEIIRWARAFGVGPFYKIDRIPLDYFQYRSQESRPKLSVAVAFSGDLQIELIEQLDEAPSPYRDFVRDHGYGLQHVASFSRQYQTDLQRITDTGVVPAVRGKVRNGPRFEYFDDGAGSVTMVEFAELMPEMALRADHMKHVAAMWDGQDPVRPYAASAPGI
jgi:Glyoxalase/Bleomycin resistance protein/Dioxygenase superfamily